MHPLLLEIKFADLLRLARDPQAPIAKEFDISAAFESLDLNNNFEMKFNVQDFGPQGSRDVHELVFQINTKKAKDKINKIQNLYKLANNTGALKAFLINGIFLSGEISYECSCSSFLYGGFKYMAKKNRDNIATNDEKRKPVQKNPELKGRICKHGIGVVANLNSFHNRIFTALQVQLKNELKKIEQEKKKNPPKTKLPVNTKNVPKKPGQKKNIVNVDTQKYYPIRVVDKYPKWVKIKLNMSNIDVEQWANKLKQGLQKT